MKEKDKTISFLYLALVCQSPVPCHLSNIKDGDQYGNFDITDETGTVYVYGLLAEKAGEKKKFQDLVIAKGIANGKKITIIGNRGEYQGKIEVLNAYFVSIE